MAKCCTCGGQADPKLTATTGDRSATLTRLRRSRSAHWCAKCWAAWSAEHKAERAKAADMQARVDALLAEGRTAEAMALVQESRRCA